MKVVVGYRGRIYLTYDIPKKMEKQVRKAYENRMKDPEHFDALLDGVDKVEQDVRYEEADTTELEE
jgi:hypothetical protein